MFSLDGIDLEFTDDALEAIAEKTLEYNTGARGLRSVFEKVLGGYMYDLPSDSSVKSLTITADSVNGTGEPIIFKTASSETEEVKPKSILPKKQKAQYDLTSFINIW